MSVSLPFCMALDHGSAIYDLLALPADCHLPPSFLAFNIIAVVVL